LRRARPRGVRRDQGVDAAAAGSVFRLRFRPVLLVLAALAAAWIGATLVLFAWPRTDDPRRADAVLVLSGGRNSRLDPALDLMHRKIAPILVISGAGIDEGWRKARALCAHGANGFRVLCFDPKPYSTRGEARELARLARRHGWHEVDVVTSRYHVFRARMILRRCYHGGLAMIGADSPWYNAPASWSSEWGKLLYQLTIQRSC
jgi:uncharacterized SAM-binding protein YcdF (DUF218 family)